MLISRPRCNLAMVWTLEPCPRAKQVASYVLGSLRYPNSNTNQWRLCDQTLPGLFVDCQKNTGFKHIPRRFVDCEKKHTFLKNTQKILKNSQMDCHTQSDFKTDTQKILKKYSKNSRSRKRIQNR